MKKNIFTLAIFCFVSIFSFFNLNTVEAQSCSNVGYDSCGNYTSRSCSGATSCSVTDLGNGSCYQTCTCPVLTLQGSSFSGWTSGTFQNGQQFCTAMYEGPACQVSGGSGASISFPAYACGTVNNTPSSVCNNNGICESGESSTYCPLDGCPPPSSSFFTLSVSPPTRSVLNGDLAIFTLTITPSVSPTSGLGDVRAVGMYTLPVPIPGCPNNATCTYQNGANTMQVTQDTTSGGVDFAVAASKDVIVAPTSVIPGTYQLNLSAVNGLNQTKSTTANLIVNSGVNGASCLSIDSQVGGISTSSFSPGQQFTLVARLRNTGTKVWDNVYTSASDQEHFLGAWSPSGDPWGAGSGRTRLPNGTAVPPNGEVTFTRTLTAPSTPGTYDFQFAIVEDGVQWITAPGAVCVKSGGVTVVSLMPNLTAGSVTPTSASINSALTFSATISNTGSGSTGASFSNFFQVATAANGGGTVTDLAATTMSTLASGATGTATSPAYTFSTAGTYSVRACADKTNSSNVGSINEQNESDNCGSWTTVTVGNGSNNASCTAITPSKTTVIPGEVFSASVTMYNNGTNTWSPNDMRSDVSGVNNYHITVSPWASTWNWGRAAVSSNVSPGSSFTFTVPLTAPSTPGTYNLSTQMLQENVEWFGALCNAGTITVSTPSSITVSIAPYYTSITNYPTTPNNSIYWTTTGNPDSCTTSGASPWNTAIILPIASGNQYQGNYPSTGTYTYNITCTKAGVPNATASITVPVSSTPIPTGTLTPASPSCTIASGASSCTVNLSWTTTNPVGTSAVTSNTSNTGASAPNTTVASGNSGTNVAVTVPYSSRVFTLYNNSSLLATSNASASCVSGTTWNGSICAPNTPITVSIAPYYTSITNYPTITDNSIYWTTTGNPDTCTTSGASPWSTAVISPMSSGMQYQGSYPGVGTYTYNITCMKAGVLNASASVSVAVSTAPPTQYTLTVTKPVGGTVTTVDTFIACGGTCARQYTGGTSVTLQAVPDTAYWRFVGWGGACSGQGVGNCTLTVSGNVAVTAVFRPKALLYQEF